MHNGKDVVIKVLKPGIADVLKTDPGSVYLAARVGGFINTELNSRGPLSDIASYLRTVMLCELDFRHELDNLNVFRTFLAEKGLDGKAAAPKPYPAAPALHVLTMERLRGVATVDPEESRKFFLSLELTLDDALNVWSLSVQKCDFFHADVHSGNLLVLEEGRVGFLDFGIVDRMPPRASAAVGAFSEARCLEEDLRLCAAPFLMQQEQCTHAPSRFQGHEASTRAHEFDTRRIAAGMPPGAPIATGWAWPIAAWMGLGTLRLPPIAPGALGWARRGVLKLATSWAVASTAGSPFNAHCALGWALEASVSTLPTFGLHGMASACLFWSCALSAYFLPEHVASVGVHDSGGSRAGRTCHGCVSGMGGSQLQEFHLATHQCARNLQFPGHVVERATAWRCSCAPPCTPTYIVL